MNRRNFIRNLIVAGASFAILPGAGRIWRAERKPFVWIMDWSDVTLIPNETTSVLYLKDYVTDTWLEFQRHPEDITHRLVKRMTAEDYRRMLCGNWP